MPAKKVFAKKKTTRRRHLGKGIDALLGMNTSADEQSDMPRKLAVDLLQRGQYQPRQQITKEALSELAQSIREQGIIQPILVRPISKGRYEIIAGERRWRAAQLAELHEIPAIVRELPDKTVMCMTLIENMQREDLNVMEEVEGIARLLKEFSMTHADIARSIGRSRSAVSNLLRLLELNAKVKAYLASGRIEMGHARALLPLDEAMQVNIANTVVAKGLSVRATEALVKDNKQKRSINTRPSSSDPDVRHLENDLSSRLGAKVVIQQQSNGKGTLKIHYYSSNELEGILRHIK